MKWKTNLPKLKDRQINFYYALLPFSIGDETRWLEWVYVVEEYSQCWDGYEWKVIEFSTKEEYNKFKNKKL